MGGLPSRGPGAFQGLTNDRLRRGWDRFASPWYDVTAHDEAPERVLQGRATDVSPLFSALAQRLAAGSDGHVPMAVPSAQFDLPKDDTLACPVDFDAFCGVLDALANDPLVLEADRRWLDEQRQVVLDALAAHRLP